MQRARAYGLRELAPAFASTRASPHAVFGALAEHTFRSARAPTGAAEAAALPDGKHILRDGWRGFVCEAWVKTHGYFLFVAPQRGLKARSGSIDVTQNPFRFSRKGFQDSNLAAIRTCR